jgi:hypothetical protein
MLMVSTFQSKDTGWWIGLKNKTQQFVAYQKCTEMYQDKGGMKLSIK